MKKELKGEIALFVSTLFFATSALLVKYISSSFDGRFISVFRFIVGIILGIIILGTTRIPFKIHDKKTWALRGALGALSMVLYYTAIQITSSGRATLLFNVYPVFVALFGYFFFKEHINIRNVLSLVLCLLGVIFVFYDGSSYSIYGDLLALLSGIIAGISMHFIKRSSQRNNPVVVYLAACFFGLVLIPFSAHQVVNITYISFILLCLVALSSFAAQIIMTYGYKYVSATKGSIISYLTVPMTIFFSYFIGEELNFKFFIGIVFIITGLIINRH